MCVFLSACVCVPSWTQWCVWWYLSHSSSVQDIISQSPGLMGKDEWWELHLPVEMRLGGIDDACLLMQASLLWPWPAPPNTWDRGGGVTQQQEQQQLLQPSLFQVSEPQFVLWWIKSAESLIALAELRPLSAQAPITVWYIEFLARAWSSLLAFQTWGGGDLINETLL